MIEHTTLLLSVQRALLGAVPPSLRGVACGWENDLITLRFIFDGPVEADDEENMQIVGTEVIADFQPPASIREETMRVDKCTSLDQYALRAWAYLRKESSPGPTTTHAQASSDE